MASKKTTKQEFGPKDFLAELGIEKPPKGGVFTEQLHKGMRARGADPEVMQKGDGFDPASGDAWFIDADIGRRVLAHDYARYVRHMKDFTEVHGWPDNPRGIAEIGCGAGVLSLWLAQQHPEASVTALDWSNNALTVGRGFAEQLNLTNIQFVQKSSEEIAQGPQQSFDLVIAFHAVDFCRDKQLSKTHFTYTELSNSDLDVLSGGPIINTVRAIAKLLSDRGVGVICGSWDVVGLMCLFHSIRQSGMGTNWSATFWDGTEGSGTQEGKHYIFVERDLPHVGESAWEDAQALLTCGEYYRRNIELSYRVLESYVDLFAEGEILAHIEFEYNSGGIQRVRLLKRSGLLLLEECSTLGFRRGFLHSMAAISDMVQTGERYDADWGSNPNGKIVRSEWAERLVPYFKAIGRAR